MKKILTMTAITLLTSTAFAAPLNDTDKMPNKNVSTYTQADQDKWWHDRDVNNDKQISLKEYVDAESKDDSKKVTEATAEFKKKDKNNDGFINASEFKAWFEKVGDKVQNGKNKVVNKTVEEKNELKQDYKNSDMNHNGK